MAIADAAVGLFLERGYDGATMDDVATAAGVSRRTAYRHFPNKEDLLFDHPTRWLEHFDAEIAAAGDRESTRDLCRRALVSVAELIQATAASVAPAYGVVASTPSLRGRTGRTQDEWVSRYVELIQRDVSSSPHRALEIELMAQSLVAMTNALVTVWSSQQPGGPDMAALTEDALDRLDPLWPTECRDVSL